jgi:Collagen triple helix repeat (20 copies)
LKSIHKRRPSTAMAVAFVALFLAVSGTATAAHLITGRQIARNAITGKHVRDHSLSARDFSGSVAGPAGPAGLNGPRGFTGAKGERGPQGDRGVQGERGLPGEAANQGLPGKDGKDGKDGRNGEDGEDGDDGRDGKDGHDGRDGKDGRDGPAGFNGVIVKTAGLLVPPGSHGTDASVECDSTQKVVGGGFHVVDSLAGWTQTLSSYPDGRAWKVRLGNTGTNQDLTGTVYALCVAG